MTLPDLLVPTYLNLLRALSAWLDKAEAQRGERAQALLAARLAPDMFPLASQVRFVCVQALEGIHRLQQRPFPPLVAEILAEARNGGEAPGTLDQARARIAQTIAAVEAAAPSLPDLDPTAPLAHELPVGAVLELTAGQYARDWALQQFTFHAVIAYAILRAQGVDLGKVDYIAHLMPFFRPDSLPKG